MYMHMYMHMYMCVYICRMSPLPSPRFALCLAKRWQASHVKATQTVHALAVIKSRAVHKGAVYTAPLWTLVTNSIPGIVVGTRVAEWAVHGLFWCSSRSAVSSTCQSATLHSTSTSACNCCSPRWGLVSDLFTFHEQPNSSGYSFTKPRSLFMLSRNHLASMGFGSHWHLNLYSRTQGVQVLTCQIPRPKRPKVAPRSTVLKGSWDLVATYSSEHLVLFKLNRRRAYPATGTWHMSLNPVDKVAEHLRLHCGGGRNFPCSLLGPFCKANMRIIYLHPRGSTSPIKKHSIV